MSRNPRRLANELARRMVGLLMTDSCRCSSSDGACRSVAAVPIGACAESVMVAAPDSCRSAAMRAIPAPCRPRLPARRLPDRRPAAGPLARTGRDRRDAEHLPHAGGLGLLGRGRALPGDDRQRPRRPATRRRACMTASSPRSRARARPARPAMKAARSRQIRATQGEVRVSGVRPARHSRAERSADPSKSHAGQRFGTGAPSEDEMLGSSPSMTARSSP